jgi:DNA mismatch endonuclease (patch repair protein)
MKAYKRDKRSPDPKSESISRLMSANKAHSTSPELALRKTLFTNGIRGYRINYNNVPGKPDIAFISKRLAIFVNGCYWHRCPKCNLPLPKHNCLFWEEKFEKNKQRDLKKTQALINLGWKVMVVWECEMKNIEEKIDEIKNCLRTC